MSYAIVLESVEDGEWTAVRLRDNADVVDEHHEHEYTRAGGKQAPAILEFSSANEAMAAAIKKTERVLAGIEGEDMAARYPIERTSFRLTIPIRGRWRPVRYSMATP